MSADGPRWPIRGSVRLGPLTRGITRNVVALGLVSLLTDVSSEMLAYVIPLFLANVLAASPSVIGVIEGAAESTAALLRIVSGAISDAFHRRRLLVGLGYGTSLVSKTLYLVAASWPVVLAARVSDRVGKGIRTAPRDALIADSTPAHARGRAFGLHRALDTTGAVIGVAVAALIVTALQGQTNAIDERTFRVLVLVALIPGVLGLAVIVLGVRDIRSARHPGGPSVSGEPTGPATRERLSLTRARAALRSLPRAYWLFVIASGLFTLGNSSDAFLSLRSQQLGVPVRDILVMVIAFNIANALISWPVGAISDRVGRRGLIGLAWGIYAASYLGFAAVDSTSLVPFLWILYGSYYGVNEAVGRALVADLAPGELRATAYGILNAVVGLVLLPASIMAGILWDRVAPAAPFWFGAACAAAAALLVLGFVRPTRAIDRGEPTS